MNPHPPKPKKKRYIIRVSLLEVDEAGNVLDSPPPGADTLLAIHDIKQAVAIARALRDEADKRIFGHNHSQRILT